MREMGNQLYIIYHSGSSAARLGRSFLTPFPISPVGVLRILCDLRAMLTTPDICITAILLLIIFFLHIIILIKTIRSDRRAGLPELPAKQIITGLIVVVIEPILLHEHYVMSSIFSEPCCGICATLSGIILFVAKVLLLIMSAIKLSGHSHVYLVIRAALVSVQTIVFILASARALHKNQAAVKANDSGSDSGRKAWMALRSHCIHLVVASMLCSICRMQKFADFLADLFKKFHPPSKCDFTTTAF
ncbi:hypothetical protein CC78DRAFT_545091 [Lojkania enalia]|uniref:Uncharacterized protein n=1 Tax=Lojkania enalia TaxID=147567 RepID=A0A9P4N347_9PLEO|nr:hypothetical protein CC78DRAFT_545091 [Didymosphaeria enalia]